MAIKLKLIAVQGKTLGQNTKPRKPIPVYYQAPKDNNKYNSNGTLTDKGLVKEMAKTEEGREVLREWNGSKTL